MDLRYKLELEVRINELAARRRTLDRQLQVRSVTMSELDKVKAESMKRLYNAVENQNEQAKARNAAIREQIYSQMPAEKSTSKVSAKKSMDKLQQAKEEYMKHVETMLPIWHRHQSVHHEENLRALQLEKALSQKRREQLQHELVRENEIKQQLERHRQELLYSLAAEQRIVLESQANAILLEEESKAINEQVANQISMSTHEIHGLVASNIQRMRQDIQQAYYAPPVIPDYTRRVAHQPEQRYFESREYGDSVTQARDRHVENLPLPIHRSGHGTLVLPAESNVDHGTENPLETARSATMSVMSPTVASAYNPRSRSSSLTNTQVPMSHLPHGVLAQSTQAAEQSMLTERSMERADHSVLHGVHTASPRFVAGATNVAEAQAPLAADAFPTRLSSRDNHHHQSNNTTLGGTSAPSLSAHQRLFGDVDLHINTGISAGQGAPGQGPAAAVGGGPIRASINHSLSYSGSKPNSPKMNASNISLLSNLGSEPEAAQGIAQDASFGSLVSSRDEADAENKPEVRSAAKSALKSESKADVSAKEIRAEGVHSPHSKASVTSPRSSFAVPIEVKAALSPTSPQHQTSLFAEEGNLSRLNSTTMSDNASFKSSSGGESIAVLVSQLSISQCTSLLQVIATAIEKRATEGPLPVSASTIYDTQSRHRAVHIIDAFLSGEGVEDVKLSAVLNNAADSTLGNAILAIVEGKSSVLIPSDAFTGVMTMDKLKKEYKRVGPPGIQTLWDRLVAHLQTLVAFKSNSLNFLSLCFTSALTAHVEEEDKSRLARKVSNLLQLALIPPETKESSSPSPPYRGRPQSSELDSPAARTSAVHSHGNLNVNNPNISGISTTSHFPDKDVNPLASNISKVTSKPAYSFANLGAAGGGYSGASGGYGGGGESSAKKGSASAALYGKAAAVLKVARNAYEFDDDEIADDETIERPPPLKDLDHSLSGPSAGAAGGANPSDITVHSQYSQLTHSSNSANDSYEERPVRTAAATPNRRGYGGISNNNNGNNNTADDEFDF